jgi:hypothetical protein
MGQRAGHSDTDPEKISVMVHAKGCMEHNMESGPELEAHQRG